MDKIKQLNMKNLYIKVSIIFSLFGAIISLNGCKEELPIQGELRLFRPEVTSSSVIANSIKVNWKQVVGAVSYTIQASQTDSFKVIDNEITDSLFSASTTGSFSATISNLEVETNYFIRIKANNKNSLFDSKWVVASQKTGPLASSIIIRPQSSDIGIDYVDVKWLVSNGGLTPDKISMIPLNGSVNQAVSHILTDEEKIAGKARVSGLAASTIYRIKITFGTAILGISEVKTAYALSGKVVVMNPTWKLQNVLDTISSGSTILFTSGVVYDFSSETISIRRDITFTGEPGKPRPLLYIKDFVIGDRNVNNTRTNIGFVKLIGLELSGITYSGGIEDFSIAPKALRAFNLSIATSGLTLNLLSFENCYVRNFGYNFIHAGGNNTNSLEIGEIKVEDCIFYDLGRWQSSTASFIFMNHDKTRKNVCNSYSISNSTFINLQGGMITAKRNTTGGVADPNCKGIIFENCTFDKFGNKIDGYFYGSTSPSFPFVQFADERAVEERVNVPLTVKNCIFGSMPLVNVPEMTSSHNVFPTVSNSYKASDCIFSLAGCNVWTSDAASIFGNRDLNDFTITDSNLKKIGLGDPRWR